MRRLFYVIIAIELRIERAAFLFGEIIMATRKMMRRNKRRGKQPARKSPKQQLRGIVKDTPKTPPVEPPKQLEQQEPGQPTKYKPEYCQQLIDYFSIEPLEIIREQEIVGTEVEREFLGLPFKRLGKIEQLAVHVCLEPCREVVAAFAPLHLDQSAGKVAVLYGRNAAHDGYFLYVVGGDGAHIDTCIGEVPLARGAVHCARKVLHVAVYAHGCTVDDEARAQRRGVVLVAGYGYFAQVYGVGHVEMGVVGTSAGQQFQQVGET